MRIGDTLKKAAGLFIEIPEDDTSASSDSALWDSIEASAKKSDVTAQSAPKPASGPTAKTIEQIVREQPGPNLDEIKPAATPAQPVISEAGEISFPAIYQLANLPDTPFSAEQILDLLSTLPAELPLETKRATVKITLSAMSKTVAVNPEGIVADASRKLAALAAYAQSFSAQADEYVKHAEEEIAALEQKIAQRKAAIDDAKAKKVKMVDACTAESDRLDDVLEFFSLDVAPSKYAKPQ